MQLGDVHKHVQNPELSNIPVTVHALHRLAVTTDSIHGKTKIGALLEDIQTTLGRRNFELDDKGSSFSNQILQFSCKPDPSPSTAKGVLTQLVDEDFGLFCKEGILLMNVPGGPGYDFAIGDGECLTVKYTKPHGGKWSSFLSPTGTSRVESFPSMLPSLVPRTLPRCSPTYLNRLEFSRYESEKDMLEHFQEEGKVAIQRELECLDLLE